VTRQGGSIPRDDGDWRHANTGTQLTAGRRFTARPIEACLKAATDVAEGITALMEDLFQNNTISIHQSIDATSQPSFRLGRHVSLEVVSPQNFITPDEFTTCAALNHDHQGAASRQLRSHCPGFRPERNEICG
jgi:hypothetical protein